MLTMRSDDTIPERDRQIDSGGNPRSQIPTHVRTARDHVDENIRRDKFLRLQLRNLSEAVFLQTHGHDHETVPRGKQPARPA